MLKQTHAEPGADFGIAPPFWRGRDALAVADRQSGRVIGWNPAAVTLVGYTSEEAVTLTLPALLPDLDPEDIA